MSYCGIFRFEFWQFLGVNSGICFFLLTVFKVQFWCKTRQSYRKSAIDVRTSFTRSVSNGLIDLLTVNSFSCDFIFNSFQSPRFIFRWDFILGELLSAQSEKSTPRRKTYQAILYRFFRSFLHFFFFFSRGRNPFKNKNFATSFLKLFHFLTCFLLTTKRILVQLVK